MGRPQAETKWGRKRTKEHFVVRESACFSGELVKVEPPILSMHHALRESCRARSGIQKKEFIGMDRPLRVVEFHLDTFGECCIDNACIEPDKQMTINRHPQSANIGAQCRRITPVLHGGGNQRSSTGKRKEVSHFPVPGSGTDTHRHATRSFDTDEHGMDRGAVGHHHRNPFTFFWFARKNRASDVVGIDVIFRPGIPTTIGDERNASGIHRLPRRNK
ncbi:unannotated protein [freshwater metagenome]|uniref:Unannotated protein n=1 Tax=freshwater metagenome TaxID=449393 RepID=A0A6J5YT69_9ZZZZ